MKKQQIHKTIERLTSNEDYRQDLWIHYLEGNSPDTFDKHLQFLHIVAKAESNSGQIKHSFSDCFVKILNNFTMLERSIISLLMLGLCVQEISQYKGISIVRVCQIIENIKSHNRWNEWHLKHHLQIKKNTA